MIRTLGRALAVAVAVVPGLACATARPAETATPPRIGIVDYEVLRDPHATTVKVEANQDFRSPLPLATNEMPLYPTALLSLALAPHEVIVRAIVGKAGEVLVAVPSPLGGGTGGEFAAQFQEAALAAVRQWQFLPAQVRTFRNGADLDGDQEPDYEVLEAEEPLKVFLDFRFVFEVQAGKGTVQALGPARG